MTSVAPDPAAVDPFEVARVELVEALARMVNRVMEHGKAEAQSALDSITEIRAILAEVANIEDFREDLEAAERVARQTGWEGALPRLKCSWKLNHCLI